MTTFYRTRVGFFVITVVIIIINMVHFGILAHFMNSDPKYLPEYTFWLAATLLNLVFQTVVLLRKDFLLSGNLYLVYFEDS